MEADSTGSEQREKRLADYRSLRECLLRSDPNQIEDFPSIEHLRGCDESVLPYHIERIAGRIEVLLRPWQVDELDQENDIVESNGKSICLPPSDRHPLAPLDSANRNPPEKCCRVISDRVGKKRADTSSPRIL